MLIREARAQDAGRLGEIFYTAVQVGAAGAYDQDQRDAWAGQQPTAEAWAKRVDGLLTLVAQDDDALVGFVSMRMDDGYLDLVFVDPAFSRRGVFSDLSAVLENRCRAAGLARLWVEASDLLKPVLAKRGWDTLRENHVQRGDVTIRNWIMEKALN